MQAIKSCWARREETRNSVASRLSAFRIFGTALLGTALAVSQLSCSKNSIDRGADAGTAQKKNEPSQTSKPLEEIGRSFILQLLNECTTAEYPNPRLEIRRVLMEVIGRNKEAAIPVVAEALRDKGNWPLRSHAALVLGDLGDRSAVPYLTKALGDAHPTVRQNAHEALEKIKANNQSGHAGHISI